MPSSTSPPQRLVLAILALLALATSSTSAAAAAAAATQTHLRGQDSTGTERRLESSLANAPSLSLHFTLKRSSMKVYGQSEFYVFANPVVSSDNTSILYNGAAAFLDGSTEYKFLLVDGIAYFVTSSVGDTTTSETATCLSSSLLPPLGSIIDALNEATAISSVTSSDEIIDCSSGSIYKLSFAGADFALCASGSSGFTIYGSDLDIAVTYLDAATGISAPALDAETALACETVATATAVTSTTLALLTGNEISADSRRHLKAEADVTISASSCSSCSSTVRPCIFIHGLGSDTEESTLQTSSDYFGDLSDSAPCCSSIQYAVLNTVDNAWTDATLQKKVCNFATSVSSSSSSSSVADTIIVTHSMGGLMMAGAIANGYCSLASSTTWVSLSAPMTGSMGSDYLQGACSGDNVFLEAVANLISDCPANTATVSLAYEDESYSTSSLNAAYVAAQSAFRANVGAAMCSDDYSGLLSTDQIVYKLAGSVIPHKSDENDGIVEYQSCAGGLSTSKFGDSYEDEFYVTGLNHADTAFLHGDALIVNSQKPVKWFECLL